MHKDTHSLNDSQIRNFLEFNGKRIATLRRDGQWWVAVKPICEVLNVHYKAQHRAISEDKILGQLSSIQRIVAADKRERKMLCLPEKFVYGWLFSINSDSEQLLLYKKKCYEILFDYFHGALTGRQKILEERVDLDYKIKEKQTELEQSKVYKEIEALKLQRKKASQSLNKMDKNLGSGQISFKFSCVLNYNLWPRQRGFFICITPGNAVSLQRYHQ